MVYVHIPFCRSFCTYCDFYSEVVAGCCKAGGPMRQDEVFGRFADALAEEVRMRSSEISDQVKTLYIGGGTPSVLPLDVLRRMTETLSSAGYSGPYDEFTVEVNPEDIAAEGAGYVEGLLQLGVNRISMGVQSFDDGILKFMNRRHNAQTARKAYSIMEDVGVENISIDLIFGIPQLSVQKWNDTLKSALEISSKGVMPRHISAYQLSVEPGSMLARMMEKGRFEEASEELCENHYRILCEVLREAGYSHYEISNFAIPGYEAVHNSAYWRHVPYVGFGPGAHSFDSVSGRRLWNSPDLKAYLADPCGIGGCEELTEEQIVLEKIMLALRTSGGIEWEWLERHCEPDSISRALKRGDLMRSEDGRARIPEERFFVSDGIIAELV